jgi:RNA polymerase sigma-70 factor (ECF subfamily)
VGVRAKELAAVDTRRCDGPAISALVRAASGGDSDAFGALYSIYRREVRATAKSVLRDDNDADEALQQTFLHAWRALATFDLSRGSFPAWLNRIATNHAYDLRRVRARYEFADDDALEALHGQRAPTDLIASEEFRSSLRLLSREQRAVIVLRYQFDWSLAEIADQLGSTRNAVAKLQRRALDRLRAAHHSLRHVRLSSPPPIPAPTLRPDDSSGRWGCCQTSGRRHPHGLP